jgi:YbbR domain-containing protein
MAASLVANASEVAIPSIRQRVLSNLFPKLITLLLVTVCWLLINARQGGLQTVPAQLKIRNLPESLVLTNDLPSELEVQLKVFSSVFASSKKMEIAADLDLSRIHEGVNNMPIDSKSIQLPLGVSVAKITPAILKIVAEKKVSRELPIYIMKAGRLPKGVKLRSLNVSPATVTVMGVESALAPLRHVQTETIDLSVVSRSRTIEVRLIPPSPQVQLSDEKPVKLNIVVSK